MKITIHIGNIIGTPESGHNDDAHDHAGAELRGGFDGARSTLRF
jgi:hypothetical protein